MFGPFRDRSIMVSDARNGAGSDRSISERQFRRGRTSESTDLNPSRSKPIRAA